jgi:hypothetical protein
LGKKKLSERGAEPSYKYTRESMKLRFKNLLMKHLDIIASFAVFNCHDSVTVCNLLKVLYDSEQASKKQHGIKSKKKLNKKC